ncbi:MAG TPA: efflux RND transporter periplasmic adaptor subunit, partial [Parachlamydiaceae bacterium]|nr:efflux RND transporter periplasmic adaptor subunit [Parachlamydiaceae bacterium]
MHKLIEAGAIIPKYIQNLDVGKEKSPAVELLKVTQYCNMGSLSIIQPLGFLKAKIQILNALRYIALCITLSACESSTPMKFDMPVIPVTAVHPSIRDVSQYIESVGTLESSLFVELRPQISGIIEEVLVHEGSEVKAGTPLIRIDDKAFKLKVNEAKAQLEIDQVTYNATLKRHQRFQSLAQKDLLSQTEWDEIEMQVAKANAALSIDRARLDSVNLDFERCTLCAPTDGRLGRMNIHPGILVSREQPTPLA